MDSRSKVIYIFTLINSQNGEGMKLNLLFSVVTKLYQTGSEEIGITGIISLLPNISKRNDIICVMYLVVIYVHIGQCCLFNFLIFEKLQS